jgi:hypothetical protein
LCWFAAHRAAEKTIASLPDNRRVMATGRRRGRWNRRRLKYVKPSIRKTIAVQLRYAILAVHLWALACGQTAPVSRQIPDSVVTAVPASPLSDYQIRQLIRQSADKDLENDKKLRDYTYVERRQIRRIDGKGKVKSTEIKTYDVMEILGEQVQKLTSKDDKPLSEKEAKKEDDKIQKLIDKRRDESQADRKKRLQKEEKERENERQFVREVADAYNFHFVGMETLDGRENYVIDADPKPGYEAHLKEADILPKFRFRAWIDKDDVQWRKVDLQCIDTVSFGLFLFRMHKGSHAVIEQTRVNDEVWLQRHITADVDFRLALLKNFDFDVDIIDRDYKKFRSKTKIIPLGEVPDQK